MTTIENDGNDMMNKAIELARALEHFGWRPSAEHHIGHTGTDKYGRKSLMAGREQRAKTLQRIAVEIATELRAIVGRNDHLALATMLVSGGSLDESRNMDVHGTSGISQHKQAAHTLACDWLRSVGRDPRWPRIACISHQHFMITPSQRVSVAVGRGRAFGFHALRALRRNRRTSEFCHIGNRGHPSTTDKASGIPGTGNNVGQVVLTTVVSCS